MFTGLVEAVGALRLRAQVRGARALVETTLGRLEPLVLGESVAVNGACLTVARILDRGFEADVSSETLTRTVLGALPQGARVHLERAMKLGGRMGGHTVLGHVDGLAELLESRPLGEARGLLFRAPSSLARFLAPKGSVALDGVSLTLNEVRDDGEAVLFGVMVVPHTLANTLLGEKDVGSRLNLEVDVLARYVARDLERSRGVYDAQGAGEPSATSKLGDDAWGSAESPESKDQRLLGKLRAGGWT